MVPDISIVLPCFNEAGAIAASLETLLSWFGDSAHLLVVDDGSTDETFAMAAAVAGEHPNVQVLRLPANRGKGAAIRAAAPSVLGDRVVLLDADLAFDESSVRAVLAALARADLAVGNRRHRESRYSVPVRLFGFLYRRHVVGLAFNMFVRTLLRVESRDTQCGLKAFRRPAWDRIVPLLSTNGYAQDAEMLLVARGLGLGVADAPVRVTYHSARSSVKLIRSGLAMTGEILRLAGRRAAGRYAPHALAAGAGEQRQGGARG
jgi:glycosyltransferase involved in cell wall biosynthesis